MRFHHSVHVRVDWCPMEQGAGEENKISQALGREAVRRRTTELDARVLWCIDLKNQALTSYAGKFERPLPWASACVALSWLPTQDTVVMQSAQKRLPLFLPTVAKTHKPLDDGRGYRSREGFDELAGQLGLLGLLQEVHGKAAQGFCGVAGDYRTDSLCKGSFNRLGVVPQVLLISRFWRCNWRQVLTNEGIGEASHRVGSLFSHGNGDCYANCMLDRSPVLHEIRVIAIHSGELRYGPRLMMIGAPEVASLVVRALLTL